MRHRRKRVHQDVELNLAAMLDMAFQLLAFFILTFRPSPVEAEIELSLPPPIPVTNAAMNSGTGNPGAGMIAGETLNISLNGNEEGRLTSLMLGERQLFAGELSPENLKILEAELKALLQWHGTPFDQVLLRVDSRLPYEVFIQVIGVAAAQTFADGSPLNKISFVEILPQ